MILVDTSVWIDALRGVATPWVKQMRRILDEGAPFGLNGLIYGEILQGARDRKQQEVWMAFFGSQRFFALRTEPSFFEDAAGIYFDCRRRGQALSGGLVDCLIAQNAMDHKLALLAHDDDYVRIAKVRPLRLVPSEAG